VLASIADERGIAVLVWNFNWRLTPNDTTFNVLVKNIPHSAVGGGHVRRTIYLVDSKHNNYYTDPAQTELVPASSEVLDYASAISTPLHLERAAVALIVFEHASGRCENKSDKADCED
jgi:hypothetical protein